MMKLLIQRECAYSQLYAVDGEDGTNYKVVTGFDNVANGSFWNIEKTVTAVSGNIEIAFSETETARMPFYSGKSSIYKIDDLTTKKSIVETISIEMIAGVAGSDYSAVSVYSIPVYLIFDYAGQASMDSMGGSYKIGADGLINNISITAQNAPVGQALIAEIYKNGSATGVTIELGSGDRTNSNTPSLSVAQGDIITMQIVQTGTSNEGAEIQIILNNVSTT